MISFLIFFSTIPNFFSQHLFQLNCTSVSHAGCPPLVNKGNKGQLPPSLPVMPIEGNNGESFSLFIFLPLHSKFFSWHLFQLNCYQLATPAALPRSIYGSRAGRRRPLLASRLEKVAVVSFCLFFIFPPPFPMFSHRSLFQLN